MPVLLVSLALPTSVVVRTSSRRSSLSRKCLFQDAILSIVARKPSHTEQVQLAAVTPPFRMSSKTDLEKLETISPSITMRSWCKFISPLRGLVSRVIYETSIRINNNWGFEIANLWSRVTLCEPCYSFLIKP